MATASATLTVNAAFLQEIKEDNQELWQQLSAARAACCEQHSGWTSRREAFETLSQVCDQLAMHFALEEAFGYFDDAIQVAPRLSEQAARLRGEHTALYAEICELVERADGLLHGEGMRRDLRRLARRFLAFDHTLAEHEAAENALIMQAFTQDVGVGD